MSSTTQPQHCQNGTADATFVQRKSSSSSRRWWNNNNGPICIIVMFWLLTMMMATSLLLLSTMGTRTIKTTWSSGIAALVDAVTTATTTTTTKTFVRRTDYHKNQSSSTSQQQQKHHYHKQQHNQGYSYNGDHLHHQQHQQPQHVNEELIILSSILQEQQKQQQQQQRPRELLDDVGELWNAHDVWVSLSTDSFAETDVKRKLGMNLNGAVDDDINRPNQARPLADAILDIGSTVLRYPGGEKTNFYHWSELGALDPTTNFWRPGTWYADTAEQFHTMNFDEFMDLCDATSCIPHVNVNVRRHDVANFDYVDDDGRVWKDEDYVTLAAEWVRYSNIVNNYNVKYWEIGNENWNDKDFSTASLAELVTLYSDAMKAVDPSIKICVSWSRNKAQELIDMLGEGTMDFFCMSNYAGHTVESFEDAYQHELNVDLTKVVHGLTLKTIVSEWNENMWFEHTDRTLNSVGKGIMNFDAACQFLSDPDVELASFWNTRWYDMNGEILDAVDDYNNLLPNVMAFKLLRQFLHDTIVHANDGNGIVSYVSVDSKTLAVSIFLINKEEEERSVILDLEKDGFQTENYDYDGQIASIHRYYGTDYFDESPSYESPSGDSIPVERQYIRNVICPPVSVTAIVLEPPSNFEMIRYAEIVYHGNGNTGGAVPVDPNEYEIGAEVVILDNTGKLVKNGYEFTGWNTVPDDGEDGTFYAAQSTVTVTDGNDGSSNGNGDNIFLHDVDDTVTTITLYAQWEIQTYRVVFHGNGHDGGHPPRQQDKVHGVALQLRGISTRPGFRRDGYIFSHWNTESDGSGISYLDEGIYTDDAPVTLFAIWTVVVTPTPGPTVGPTTTPPSAVNPNRDCQVNDRCGECDPRDCDNDNQCEAGLLCADQHRQELLAANLDPRQAYCDSLLGVQSNWELCYDPSRVSPSVSPTPVPMVGQTIEPPTGQWTSVSDTLPPVSTMDVQSPTTFPTLSPTASMMATTSPPAITDFFVGEQNTSPQEGNAEEEAKQEEQKDELMTSSSSSLSWWSRSSQWMVLVSFLCALIGD